MDRSQFTGTQSQFLVEIPGGHAFVPPALPPRLDVPRSLLLADGDARAAVGELVGQSRKIEASLLIAPLRRREAVLSNVIEGTYTQVEDVLLGEATEGRRETPAEAVEVLRTLDAISLGQQWLLEGRPLSVGMIVELHALLLRSARGELRHPGEFRTKQVYLGAPGSALSEARYVPPPWEQVRPLMEELITFVRSGPTYGPLIDAALLHYQFEAIHPFEDGNGRLGRALISLYWLERELMPQPLLYLGGFFAKNRDLYIERLAAVSRAGDWVSWLEFFISAVVAEARDALLRLRRIEELVSKYRARASAASRSNVPLRVIESVVDRVYVSVGDLVDETSASVPTAREAIRVLESIGLLQPGPRVQGKQYWVAAEVIEELYRLE